MLLNSNGMDILLNKTSVTFRWETVALLCTCLFLLPVLALLPEMHNLLNPKPTIRDTSHWHSTLTPLLGSPTLSCFCRPAFLYQALAAAAAGLLVALLSYVYLGPTAEEVIW